MKDRWHYVARFWFALAACAVSAASAAPSLAAVIPHGFLTARVYVEDHKDALKSGTYDRNQIVIVSLDRTGSTSLGGYSFEGTAALSLFERAHIDAVVEYSGYLEQPAGIYAKVEYYVGLKRRDPSAPDVPVRVFIETAGELLVWADHPVLRPWAYARLYVKEPENSSFSVAPIVERRVGPEAAFPWSEPSLPAWAEFEEHFTRYLSPGQVLGFIKEAQGNVTVSGVIPNGGFHMLGIYLTQPPPTGGGETISWYVAGPTCTACCSRR